MKVPGSQCKSPLSSCVRGRLWGMFKCRWECVGQAVEGRDATQWARKECMGINIERIIGNFGKNRGGGVTTKETVKKAL